jgi:general secretion pathway protein D
MNRLLLTLLLVTSCTPAHRTYIKAGDKAALLHDYDTALIEYKKVLDRDPGNIEYRLKYEQSRFAAAFLHYEKGHDAVTHGDYSGARAELMRALEIDPTHALAQQQLENIDGRAAAQTPTAPAKQSGLGARSVLEPKVSGPISVQMVQDGRAGFEALARLAGLNVIFDPDFRSANVPIALDNVTIFVALDTLALQTRSFWQPVNKNTILVAPDNQTKRREYEEHVLKTIYLSNSTTSTELTEAVTVLRTMLSLRFVAPVTALNAIVIRDTRDRVAIAEKIIEDIDKPKSEVVVDATVLEVDRNYLRQLGILPPQKTTVSRSTSGNDSSASDSTSKTVPLDLQGLSAQSFSLTVPDTVAELLESDSNTRLLQNPRVRASDGKLAKIRIGSRIPVASGSYQPTTTGSSAVVQFQYVDIGVNLDITPHVLMNHEIAIQVVVQIQALAGDRNVGGVTLPVFSNRSVDHEIRLKEGETNILAGLITDTEATSLNGWPGLSKIPLLKYLFAQEQKSRDKTEIIIMLTPHIVRMPDITESNQRGVSVGTEANTRLRTEP